MHDDNVLDILHRDDTDVPSRLLQMAGLRNCGHGDLPSISAHTGIIIGYSPIGSSRLESGAYSTISSIPEFPMISFDGQSNPNQHVLQDLRCEDAQPNPPSALLELVKGRVIKTQLRC
jgi:hypothetical protein